MGGDPAVNDEVEFFCGVNVGEIVVGYLYFGVGVSGSQIKCHFTFLYHVTVNVWACNSLNSSRF